MMQKSETKTGIKSWDSKPWSFEDWRSIRENLDADDASTLGIRFVDSEYQNIVRYQRLVLESCILCNLPSVEFIIDYRLILC